MSLNINPFNYLPEETLYHIFSYLSLKELVACSGVDSLFHRVSNAFAWKVLFPEVEIPEGHCIKDYTVFSEDQLIKNVNQFVKKIQLGQSGRITFKVNDHARLTVTLNDDSTTWGTSPTIEKTMLIAKNIPTICCASQSGSISFIHASDKNRVEGRDIDHEKCVPTIMKVHHILKTRSLELVEQRLSQYQHYLSAAVATMDMDI